MRKERFQVVYTEKTDEKALHLILKKTKQKFKYWGLDIEFSSVKKVDFDESDNKNYSLELSKTFSELKITKSVKTEIIRAFYDSKNPAETVVLFVNKKKAIEQAGLRGQANFQWGFVSTIEIYSEPKKFVSKSKKGIKSFYKTVSSSKNSAYQHDEYVLIHEILHILSAKYTGRDILHEMIEADLFEQYGAHVSKVSQEKINGSISPVNDIVNLNGYNLKPEVERRLKGVFREMAYAGFPMRVIEGFRSCERQNELFKRTPKVTNAQCGFSLHQYGVAVDCNFIVYGYDAPEWLWQRFGDVAKSWGFEWGGDWKNFQDRPHIQLTFGYDILDFKNGLIDEAKYK